MMGKSTNLKIMYRVKFERNRNSLKTAKKMLHT